MRVCIVGASGKLGQYMVQHALDRGYEVAGVCREQSIAKLAAFKGRMVVVPGATGDPILASNITRRVDFALFMVAALENDELIHEAPAIVGCQTPSALAHAATRAHGDQPIPAAHPHR